MAAAVQRQTFSGRSARTAIVRSSADDASDQHTARAPARILTAKLHSEPPCHGLPSPPLEISAVEFVTLKSAGPAGITGNSRTTFFNNIYVVRRRSRRCCCLACIHCTACTLRPTHFGRVIHFAAVQGIPTPWPVPGRRRQSTENVRRKSIASSRRADRRPENGGPISSPDNGRYFVSTFTVFILLFHDLLYSDTCNLASAFTNS